MNKIIWLILFNILAIGAIIWAIGNGAGGPQNAAVVVIAMGMLMFGNYVAVKRVQK